VPNGISASDPEAVMSEAWPVIVTLAGGQWTRIRGIGISLSDFRATCARPSAPITNYLLNEPQPAMDLESKLARHNISLSVFMELPEHVQSEIMADLGLTATGLIGTSSTTNTAHPKPQPPRTLSKRAKQKQSSPSSSQLTLTQLWRKPVDRQDPELPEGVDKEFLLSLPSSIRRELIDHIEEALEDFGESGAIQSPTKKSKNQVFDLTLPSTCDFVERLPVSFKGKWTLQEILTAVGAMDEGGVLELEAFLLGLIDYNCVEQLAVVMRMVKDEWPRLYNRTMTEFSRRNGGKALRLN
jgi:hypothetical protein